MSAGVVLTEEAFRRMVEAVRWVERQRGLTQRPVAAEGGVDPVYVRTTSGTADADGNYPGVVCLYSASAEAWQEYSAVKLRPANSEKLINNYRYPARPAGRTAAGDELYAVHQFPQIGVRRLRYIDIGLGTTEEVSSFAAKSIDVWDSSSTSGVEDTGLRVSQSGAQALIALNAASGSAGGAVTAEAQAFGGLKTFVDGAVIPETKWIEFQGESSLPGIQAGKVRAIAGPEGLNIQAYAGSGYGDQGVSLQVLGHGSVSHGEVVITGYNSSGTAITPTISVYKTGSGIVSGGSATVDGVEFVAGLYVGGSGGTGLTGTVP